MRKSKEYDNSFAFFKDVYETTVKLQNISKIGVVGSVLTLNPYIFAGSLIASQITKNLKREVLLDISTCDEYQRLGELFDIVFELMKKNIQEFDYKSIENIYAYYIYILTNNYLCANKCTQNTPKQAVHYEPSILEELALNNHGLCRNYAPVLTHLMNDFGYQAKTTGCQMIKCEGIPDIPFYKYENVNFSNKLDKMKFIGEKQRVIMTRQYKKDYPKKPKYVGNHMISQIEDDEYTYYLDSSVPQIYIPIKGRKDELLSPTGDIIIFPSPDNKKAIFNDRLPNKAFKNPYEVIFEFARIETELEENQDILEQFHKEIKEPLEEAERIYQQITIPKKEKKFLHFR